VSGNHDRNLGMDKLQSEYEALQQKLALLKRDSNRDGKQQQSTPMASIPEPRLAAAAAGEAPPSGFPIAEPASAAPDSTIAGAAMARPGSCSGDTGPLSFGSMSVLQSCENLQLQCSIPDAGGVLQSLKFQAKHPGSRMAQLAESSFGDTEFVQLCEQGLTAQLQRTRDGATAQSRIAELAGAVLIAGSRHGYNVLDAALAQLYSSWRTKLLRLFSTSRVCDKLMYPHCCCCCLPQAW
jgi:nucleolar protein 58